MLRTSPHAGKADFSLESIASYQRQLDQQNFIYLQADDPDFDWIKFSKLVTGKTLMQQYGKDVFHVQWDPKFLNLSDARGKRQLLPHTEASDYPAPPKYLALWCQKPADCGGGKTTIASVSDFLAILTAAEKQKLMETTHYFGATNGIHANRTQGATHHLLSFVGEKPTLRFSCNYISHGDYSPDPENLAPFTPDPFLADISERLMRFFEANALRIRMSQYSLLLWDNESMLHSRTTYTDPTRKLERIFLA